MTAFSLAAYRQQNRREVVLPSGITAIIRRCDLSIFVGLGELPLPPPPADEEAPARTVDDILKLRPYLDQMVAEGTIDPPLTAAVDADGRPVMDDTRLHVRELLLPDYFALVNANAAFMGLTVEDGDAIRTFRPDAERQSVESPGGGVSDPAAPDPQPDPVGTGVRSGAYVAVVDHGALTADAGTHDRQ